MCLVMAKQASRNSLSMSRERMDDTVDEGTKAIISNEKEPIKRRELTCSMGGRKGRAE